MVNKIGNFLMLLGILAAAGGAALGPAFGYPAAGFLFVVGAILYFWRE